MRLPPERSLDMNRNCKRVQFDLLEIDADRTPQHVVRRHIHLACLTQQPTQRSLHLFNRHQAQLVGIAMMGTYLSTLIRQG